MVRTPPAFYVLVFQSAGGMVYFVLQKIPLTYFTYFSEEHIADFIEKVPPTFRAPIGQPGWVFSGNPRGIICAFESQLYTVNLGKYLDNIHVKSR